MLDQQKIDMFIMTNQKYFPEEKIVYLKDKLRTMDDDKFSLISTVQMKDPQHCASCLNFSRRTRDRQIYDRRHRYGDSQTFDLWLLRRPYHYRLVHHLQENQGAQLQ